MALTITPVPDIKYVWGESGRAQAYNLQPAANDYPTGGYVITASQVELGKLVGLDLLFTSGTGNSLLYSVVFIATGPLTNPQTQVNMVVSLGGTQIANGVDLSGTSWSVLAIGW
jgi:hypothetical protein